MTVYSDAFAPTSVEEQKNVLTVSVVDTENGFDEIEEEWKALVDKSQATIFQTFEWQRTWWKYMGRRRELYCIVCTDGEMIVGILPLFREKVRVFGLRVATWLRFIGTGLSDYLEPIILPGFEEVFWEAVLDHLYSHKKDWDIFELSDINVFTPLSKRLIDCMRDSGSVVHEYSGTLCSHVPLPSTWEGFLQQLGRHAKHELKRKTEKLKENFQFEVEKFGDRVTDVGVAVDAFASIHGGRWKGLGYESAFDDPEHLDFHIQVAEKFADRGWLRIYFLKLNGERVAVNFSFNFHNHIYVYQANASGSSEAMRYSPGYVLHCQAIKSGIEEGMEIYDMLRGKEAYKYKDFKCVQSPNSLVRVVTPGLATAVRFKLFIMLEVVKKVPVRMKREYHEFKRYLITEKPSAGSILRFLANKGKDLVNLAGSYFSKFLSRSGRSQKDTPLQE